MNKRVAIVQSNYIPWKGYFDLIAAVDEFVFYDDVQFTKNDWRNRNKIKTPRGVEWLSIPVGPALGRRIRDVPLPANAWRERHWSALRMNYGRASHYEQVAELLNVHYHGDTPGTLTELNRRLIETICSFLGIATQFRYSWELEQREGKSERLADLCRQLGASEYVSGPGAKSYLDESTFAANGIKVSWFDYSDYPEYPQLWGEFRHDVTILDLIFNCGDGAARYMKCARA